MRGRTPRPTKLQILDGEKASRLRNNPKPSAGMARCPAFLSAEARKKWRELAPQLVRLGIMTSIDTDLLCCYCETWATLREAQKIIVSEGQTYMRDGLAKKHPCVSIAQQAARDLRLIGSELGLSPLSRQRLDVEPPPPAGEDELESILNGTYNPGPGGVRSRNRAGGVAQRDRKATAAEVRELDRFLNEPQDPPQAPPA